MAAVLALIVMVFAGAAPAAAANVAETANQQCSAFAILSLLLKRSGLDEAFAANLGVALEK